MRHYDLDITDANDATVAFWSKLTEEDLMTVLRSIVVVRGYHMSIRIWLPGE